MSTQTQLSTNIAQYAMKQKLCRDQLSKSFPGDKNHYNKPHRNLLGRFEGSTYAKGGLSCILLAYWEFLLLKVEFYFVNQNKII